MHEPRIIESLSEEVSLSNRVKILEERNLNLEYTMTSILQGMQELVKRLDKMENSPGGTQNGNKDNIGRMGR